MNLVYYKVKTAIGLGATTVEAIARHDGSIYPNDIIDAIGYLRRRGEIMVAPQGFVLSCDDAQDSVPLLSPLAGAITRLPPPHPLDYDWRFDEGTANRLANDLIANSGSSLPVVLLGAPSVFVTISQTVSTPPCILLDRCAKRILALNPHLPTQLELVSHDLLSPDLWKSNRKGNVALADPPWYVEHYVGYLANASLSVVLNGQVFLSLFPLTTRPDAPSERDSIITMASSMGLALERLSPGALLYLTPDFERASLQAAGQYDLLSWRRGDLAVFRKVAAVDEFVLSQMVREAVKIAPDDGDWHEFVLPNLDIVKIRGPLTDACESPSIFSLLPDDTLPTVSRRFPVRQKADLWLSDNRIFGLRGRAHFAQALSSFAPDSPASSRSCDNSRAEIAEATRLLKIVLKMN